MNAKVRKEDCTLRITLLGIGVGIAIAIEGTSRVTLRAQKQNTEGTEKDTEITEEIIDWLLRV